MIKKSVLAEIQNRFPGFSYDKFKLLALIAYLGEVPNSWALSELFRQNSSHAQSDIKSLEQEGYLHAGTIVPEKYFDVTLTMLALVPELEQSFRKREQFRTGSVCWLWTISKSLAKGESIAGIKRHPEFREDLSRYLEGRMKDPAFDGLRRCMNMDENNCLVIRLLQRKMHEDTLTPQWLDSLDRRVARESWLSDETYDAIGAYYYFCQGFVPAKRPDNYHPTWWAMGADAVRALHSSDISSALDKFREALSEKGRTGNRGDCFQDPVLDWFYAVCLARAAAHPSTKDSRRLADADTSFARSCKLGYSESANPALLLDTYRRQSGRNVSKWVSDQLDNILKGETTRYQRHMIYLLLRYFKCSYSQELANGLLLGQVPQAAIVQHEMSTYLPLPDQQKEKLDSLFGSKPTLEFIPRKEDWELFLGSFASEIKVAKTAEKRIAYYLYGLEISSIINEEKGADGKWKRVSTIERSQFVRGRFESANDSDLRVSQALANKMVDIPDAEVLFPNMHGSDRIFVGSPYGAGCEPASVIVEKPCLNLRAGKDRIFITSNMPLVEGKVRPCSVTMVEDYTYAVCEADERQREILQRFLSVGSMPLSASSMLRQAVEPLGEYIDINMDLRESDELMLEGETALAVRISPDKGNSYKLTVQACPLENGDTRYSPGEGEQIIYDSAEGVSYKVQRNLVQEYSNYELLHDYLKDNWNQEFTTYQEATFYGPEILLGIMNLCHDNPDSFFMEWPEGQILKFKGTAGGSIDIQVQTNVQWFEIESSIDVEGKKVSLEEVLKMYGDSDIEGYLKVGEKEYARMSETLKKHIDQMTSLGATGKKHSVNVPLCQVGSLAATLGEGGGINAEFDDAFKALLDKMETAYRSNPAVPEGLRAELRPYQEEGYKWMTRLDAWGAGACLADDMGLGKTVQSIAFLLNKAQQGPSLVVAPKSVIPNWEAEIGRFAPSLNVRVLNEVSDRKECVDEASPGDVLLVTYGVLVTESGMLSQKQWNVACLDEAHQIKNRSTQMAKAAMALNASSRIALTGTPVQNHLGELWSLFQFINPGILGTWAHFSGTFMMEDLDGNGKETLKGLTQPFILRRTKEEVLMELPDKTNIDRMVILNSAEKKEYENMRVVAEAMFSKDKGAKAKAKAMAGAAPLKLDYLAELTKLRLMANAPSLVIPSWRAESSKVAMARDIISTLLENGENNIILFSQFTSLLDIIGQGLTKEGIDYLYLDGSTPMTKRSQAVADFQSGKCRLFLISLKAGGLGLNLTKANYVILMDPWWNPAIEQQATDRAHRIGQRRDVTVIRLIAQGTIEEKILRLHETKKELSDTILDGTADSFKLSMDDVLDMVSPFR